MLSCCDNSPFSSSARGPRQLFESITTTNLITRHTQVVASTLLRMFLFFFIPFASLFLILDIQELVVVMFSMTLMNKIPKNDSHCENQRALQEVDFFFFTF